jgi:glutamate decarboxylase
MFVVAHATKFLQLIEAVKNLLLPYIRAADEAAPIRANGGETFSESSALVESHSPRDLVDRLAFSLPQSVGRGRDGLLESIRGVLKYSVNTWDQGFLDKLYASTNAVRVRSKNSSRRH